MLIRIFPHTQEEFVDEIALKYWLKHELPDDERKGIYHLRSTRGVGAIAPGSVVLFRFGNNIVGSAVVKKETEPCNKTIEGVYYEGQITLEPDSIKIYDPSIPIEFLEALTNRKFTVARTYFKIELREE